MRAHIEAIGVLAPGLVGWEAARAAAAGTRPVEPQAFTLPVPKCLPAAERRRSSATARLAIAAAEQAIEASGSAAAAMAMVFAAAEASGEISHQLCEVLAGTREVSPTTFHNSVHNAPVGYLSIATGARLSATSLCRGPWTFAAGFAYAALQAQCDARAVLFACYDSPMPFPLRESFPVTEPTAVAFVLTPAPSQRTIASCELSWVATTGEPPWPEWIPAAWRANPSARALAALGAWAAPGAAAVRVPAAPGLDLEIRC
jgi:hypothetical protein